MSTSNVSERLSTYMPVIVERSDVDDFLETVKRNPRRFDDALALLEDMVAQNINFKYAAAGETAIDIIPRLTSSSDSRIEKVDEAVAKIKALLKIGSLHAVGLAAKPFSKMDSAIMRENIFAEIIADETPEGIEKSLHFAEVLNNGFSWANSIFLNRGDIIHYEERAKKVLLKIMDDRENPSHKSVYDIVVNKAKDKDVWAIQLLSEYGTRQSYRDMKLALSTFQIDDSLENIVFRVLKNPAAYRAYMGIIADNDRVMQRAKHTLQRHMPEEATQRYLSRLAVMRKKSFDRVEAEQLSGADLSDKADDYFWEAAHHYVDADAARAMTMIARDTSRSVSYTLASWGFNYDQRDLCIDLYTERGHADELVDATGILLDEMRSGRLVNNPETQERKRRLIAKFAQLPAEAIEKKEVETAYRAYAQVEGFATAETTEFVLADLIGKNTDTSMRILSDMVTDRGNSSHYYQAINKRGDPKLVSFEAPSKAIYTFAFQEMVKVEQPNAKIFGLIRYIANELKGDYLQQAHDYLQANGSVAATTQIKFLQGDIDTMSSIKKLPLDRAIWELTNSFKLNAVGSLSALLDLRQDALSTGQNDVSEIDKPLLEGVRKLVDAKKPLLDAIREGKTDEMKVLFDRLAAAGLADVRKRFNLAVRFVVGEDEQKALNAQLTQTPASYPEQKII